jgi:hypothetical protein
MPDQPPIALSHDDLREIDTALDYAACLLKTRREEYEEVEEEVAQQECEGIDSEIKSFRELQAKIREELAHCESLPETDERAFQRARGAQSVRGLRRRPGGVQCLKPRPSGGIPLRRGANARHSLSRERHPIGRMRERRRPDPPGRTRRLKRSQRLPTASRLVASR